MIRSKQAFDIDERSRMAIKMFILKSFLIRLIICLTTITLCSWQIWNIADEYFKYPTITYVTLVNIPPVTLPPMVGFRIKNRLKAGITLKTCFDKVKDKTELVESRLRYGESWGLKNNISLKIFIRAPDYYISVAAKEEIKYSPEHLYTTRREMIFAKLRTNLLTSDDNGVTMDFFLKSYHGDLEGIQKTDSMIFCPTVNNRSTCDIRFSYWVKMTKLAPSPYDTNCRDYRKMGFTSNENCLSQCLNNFTEKHGYMIETNVIPGNKYRNSSLRILSFYFRKLQVRGQVVTEELIRKAASESIHLPYKAYFLYWADIFPSYKRHHDHCKSLCGKQDCIRESLVPHLLLSRDSGNKSSSLEYLDIRIYPSDDEVVIVTSKAKLGELDLIVYVLSATSFWFGFCPLSLTTFFKNSSKNNSKQKKGRKAQSRE